MRHQARRSRPPPLPWDATVAILLDALRELDEDELTSLLAARPDLLAAPTLAALSQRMVTPASTSLAVSQLTAPSRQVLEALCGSRPGRP